MALTKQEKITLALLVLAALVIRTYFAWIGQWSTDPDRGVASLMAMHMAEGRAWPFFFYGQGYMGSLEPLVASLFCRLFGVSGFTVCLGTAVPAALMLIPIYFLTRRIAGPFAGAAAAAFLVVGPDAFVAYTSSPRGGYTAILVLNTLILLLAARLADLLWQNRTPQHAEGVWLGLCGGLGWWVGPMVLPALGAAGLVLAAAVRGRLWHRSIWQAALAFLAGSAPWWWWNAQHGWISLSMRKAVGGVDARETFGVLILRIWRLLGWLETGWSATVLVALLGGGLILIAALAASLAWRERRREALWALAALSLYGLLFSCAYSVSSFSRVNTMRYVLPVLPVLSVCAGLLAALAARAYRGLGFLVLLPFVLPPIYLQITLPPEEPQEKKMVLAAPKFADLLAREGIDVVFAEYAWHWANFATLGKVPVVEPAGDAAPINDRAGLLARHPAYWPNGDFAGFLRRTQSEKRILNTSLGKIYTDLQPCPQAWRVLDAAMVETVRGTEGDDPAHVMDGNLDTAWEGESAATMPVPLIEITFRQPVEVAGLLLFSRDDQFPLYAAVEGRVKTDAPWEPLVPEGYMSGWYWSGPQAYFRDLYRHLELRCPATQVTQLRLRLPPSPRRSHYSFRLSELVVMEAAQAEATNSPPDLEAIREACQHRRIQQLYANRWVADRLAARDLPDLALDHSQRLNRRTSDVRSSRRAPFSTVSNLAQRAFFCEPGTTAYNYSVLEEDGHQAEQIALPGGTLLVVTNANPNGPALEWTGMLLFGSTNSAVFSP